MNWETYLAFGDSITIGARTYVGYPELTGKLLENALSKQWNVINHAVSGFTAIDLARYIDQHIAALQTHKAGISTILIGTNDVKQQTHPEDFKTALNLVILKAKLLTVNSNVILIRIPELHKGIMYPYAIGMNETIAVFNDIIDEMGRIHQLRVLQLQHDATDFVDGVHLNRAGIARFADQIAGFILNDRGIHAD